MRGLLGVRGDATSNDEFPSVVMGGRTMFVFEARREGWDLMRRGSMHSSVFVPHACMCELREKVLEAREKGSQVGNLETQKGTIFSPQTSGVLVRTARCAAFPIERGELVKFLIRIAPEGGH